MRSAVQIAIFVSLAVPGTLQAQEEAVLAFRDPTSSSDASAVPLSFSELFDGSSPELTPSQRLLSLQGKRVRMVGYMVRMENPPLGAFYLAPRPVVCDEEGGGNADLPVENVKVIVQSARGRKVAVVPRPIEVIGILEVGNQEDQEGQVSGIRLILANPKPKHHSARRGKSL